MLEHIGVNPHAAEVRELEQLRSALEREPRVHLPGQHLAGDRRPQLDVPDYLLCVLDLPHLSRAHAQKLEILPGCTRLRIAELRLRRGLGLLGARRRVQGIQVALLRGLDVTVVKRGQQVVFLDDAAAHGGADFAHPAGGRRHNPVDAGLVRNHPPRHTQSLHSGAQGYF